MIRQAIFVTDLFLSLAALVIHFQTSDASKLQTVATFQKNQPTGVAVSREGRVFVNFPRWSDQHEFSVVEVLPDGGVKPYPDRQWNSWNQESQGVPASQAFVCVQSVWVDDDNMLWILDPAAPYLEQVVPGGPKLVKVNLATNKVDKVISFDETIAPQRSYLNDVRIDTNRDYAYITESGLGAIIAVNLESGKARRLLADHPSTKAEPNVTITVKGKQLRDQSGNTPHFNADGIALSKDGEYLYYHALTGKTLYRIKTDLLRNEQASPQELASGVEKVAETVVTDGMLIDDRNNVYHTALEQDAIVYLTPDKQMKTLVKDEKISWPDSMAFGRNSPSSGELYFTTSQIQNMPRFNQGKETRSEPYHVFKTKLPRGETAMR